MIFDVFIEAFKHQLLPLFAEVTLPAMKAFGITPLSEPLIAAIGGAFICACLLYAVGYVAAERVLKPRNPERYTLLHQKLSSTLLLTMLVLGSPVGFVLAFSAGYIRTPRLASAALALLGLGAHYGLSYGS